MDLSSKELIDAIYAEQQFSFLRLPCEFNSTSNVELKLRKYLSDRMRYEQNYKIWIADPYNDSGPGGISGREKFIADGLGQRFSIAADRITEDGTFKGFKTFNHIRSYNFKNKNSLIFGGVDFRQITPKINEIFFFNFAEYFKKTYLDAADNNAFVLNVLNRCASCILSTVSYSTNEDIEELEHIFCEYKVPSSWGKLAKLFDHHDFNELEFAVQLAIKEKAEKAERDNWKKAFTNDVFGNSLESAYGATALDMMKYYNMLETQNRILQKTYQDTIMCNPTPFLVDHETYNNMKQKPRLIDDK